MRPQRGFTLVELLVALFVMSLLAVLSWRGLDGMVRGHEQMQQRQDQVHALQIGLDQWSADLDAMVDLPQFTTIEWNGRVLRMTRTAPGGEAQGVVVAAWARRADANGARWMRWQSPAVTTRGGLDEAWRRADAWAAGQAVPGAASEVGVTALVDWQVFFYRRDAWTNPLSNDTTQAVAEAAATPASAPPAQAAQAAQAAAAAVRKGAVPDGVRIVLTLAPPQAITGDITRDWVRPTIGGNKS